MTQPPDATTTLETTGTETTITMETVLLYAAQDAQGRLFLTDDRAHLPLDAEQCRELALAPTQVTWAMLQVEVEEIRGRAITIHVGDYHYATPHHDTVPQPTSADRTVKGETRCRLVSDPARP